MNNFLGSIYSWFVSLYGDALNYYLWGFDPLIGDYTNPNIYNHIGLATLAISLVIILVFYYVINHPKFNKWWSWLLMLIINSIINFGVGYFVVYAKYTNGIIPPSLMYQFDEEGNILAFLITNLNCIGLGLANCFVAAIFFLVFTFMFKWWSSNAKHAPII